MVEMDPETFEQLVTEVLDELPDEMVDGLDNVVFLVEDEHPEEDLLGTTLVHEIAHFYGIDDEQLHELGWA